MTTTRTYTFTAFTAEDLLRAGDGALGRGDVFTMPADATTLFVVQDNDSTLSGDNLRNENANDTSGQTASITDSAGAEIGNGRQIYAESYHWVSDQHGNWYVLIEIEQEGVSGGLNDYFTFYTGGCYSVPPAGAVLTVHGACNVCGDWLQYCNLDGGDPPAPPAPPGAIHGRFFFDEDHDATEWNADDGGWEPGVSGAVVQLLDASGAVVATTTTNADGGYAFLGVAPGDYRVKFFSPDGYEFVQKDVGSWSADSDANANGVTDLFHVASGQTKTNIDAGVKMDLGSIQGRFFLDADGDDTEWNAVTGAWEAGVANAEVRLIDSTGAVVATTTTDADGGYRFDGVRAGDYRVKFFSPEGFEFVRKDIGGPGIDSDADASGLTDLFHLSAGAHLCNIDAGVARVLVLDAVDDTLVVLETEGAGASNLNVLANDIDDFGPAGPVLKVDGQTAAVGQWIDLAGGGRVRLDANGELDFDADGDFDALDAGESATVTLTYTIAEIETAPPVYQCLDFNHLARGTIVTNQFASAGLTVASANPSKPVMIFDTANPTGGDWDLATSNLGKVLIISENGSTTNPDDNAGGGTFIFTFDRPAQVTSLTFLDTEEPVPVMRFFDEGGALITTIHGPVTADNGQGVSHFDVSGVARMEVTLAGSGAIDNLVYTLPGVETVIAEDTATVTIIVEGVDDPNAPPVALDDAITIDEDGVIAPDAASALNVLANDSDPENGPLTVSAVEGGTVGAPVTVRTANGVDVVVILDANGDLRFDTAGLFDDLPLGASDSFTLGYTAADSEGAEATATITVVIEGLNEPPVALDDAITIGESDEIGGAGAFALNLLDNDSDPNGDALSVASVEGVALEGGSAVVTATTAGGRVVDVTIAADGAVSFATAGAFDGLNEGETDSLTLAYTAVDGKGGEDDATLTITINGEGQAAPTVSYNIIFLLDASASLVGSSGAGAAIIGADENGQQRVLDLNGDGVFNSEFDASLLITQKLVSQLGALGLGDVEIGIATFDSELGFGTPNAPVERLTDTDGDQIFAAGADLSSAFIGTGGSGFAFYNTAIDGANDFFAETTANDAASTVNLVFLMTDGTGLNWTAGGDPALAAELAQLRGFDATLDTLLLDAAGAGSPLIAQMEASSGDGVASILDDDLAVTAYVGGLGDQLIA